MTVTYATAHLLVDKIQGHVKYRTFMFGHAHILFRDSLGIIKTALNPSYDSHE